MAAERRPVPSIGRDLLEHELFVLWFVRAFVVDSSEEARTAVTGGSADKGIDAVYIDEYSRNVFVVQGKYRINGGRETRNDVLQFAELGRPVHGSNDEYRAFAEGLDPLVEAKLGVARERVRRRHYGLNLYYVTLGSVSRDLQNEGIRVARRNSSEWTVLARDRVFDLLDNYLDGVAPPIPFVELPIESSPGPIYREDRRTGIHSWVFSIRGGALAKVYEQSGVRLCARNIRGFLGLTTPINDAIRFTIEHEPDYFWYYNNGVTMICDEADQNGPPGSAVLRVTNPQIINGQQTTRSRSG